LIQAVLFCLLEQSL